jgi:hypothetical protein
VNLKETGQGQEMDARVCNRAVVALHKRAIEHLIRADEYVAIHLWKQALKCINGTASPEEALESPSPKSMVSSSKEIVSTPFIQEHIDWFSRLVAIPPACLSLADILPSKVFLLNETSILDDSVCPRVVRDGLAAIVLYHIAVSLHRAGILKGYQYLVNYLRRATHLTDRVPGAVLQRCVASKYSWAKLTVRAEEDYAELFQSCVCVPSRG